MSLDGAGVAAEGAKAAPPQFGKGFHRPGGAPHGRVGRRGKGGHGAALPADVESLRSAVMALRRATDARSAAQAAASLQSALVEVEASSSRVDGALIGMAAAQSSRLALKETLNALCAFAWCRLGQYGGREVAELASGAAKHGCGDSKFFHFVGGFCRDHPSAFGCLRDVALMAATLLKKAGADQGGGGPKLDSSGAFRGLVLAALPHLQCGSDGSVCVRDVAEFLYALAHMLDRKAGDGNAPLYQDKICADAVSASVSLARRSLHHATPQDVAKLMGAVATAWPLIPNLRLAVLQPFVVDLSQAVRFRCQDFNPKDVGAIVLALAKLDVSESLVGEVVSDQVERCISRFVDKDLSLLLWACSRQGWVGRRLSGCAIVELQQRDLSRLLVVDLCMVVQALAKLGPPAKATLCLVAGEAFNRQLQGFSTADKALMLWSLAKARICHMALCRLLIRSLAAERSSAMQRDVVSATLWALASFYPSLMTDDEKGEEEEWPRKLTQDLCTVQPWRGCLPFEIANAAWSFSQLPVEWTTDFWPSLIGTAKALKLDDLSLHELCNLLSGVALCPQHVAAAQELTDAILGEVTSRTRGGAQPSGHDKRSMDNLLSFLETSGPLPAKFEELASLFRSRDSGRTRRQELASGAAASSVRGAQTGQTAPADQAAGCVVPQVPMLPTAATVDVGGELSASPRRSRSHGKHDHGQHGAGRHGELPDALEGLKLNLSCDFNGHCVQLRNTFIHVDCAEEHGNSDDDCVLCGHIRRRARSADNLSVPADALLPGGSPAGPRPQVSPRIGNRRSSPSRSSASRSALLPVEPESSLAQGPLPTEVGPLLPEPRSAKAVPGPAATAPRQPRGVWQ